MGKFNKLFLLSVLVILFGLFFGSQNHAFAIASVSDTLSTSRPSAAAPLDAAQAPNDAFVTVKDLPATLNNSALWMASDSAFLMPNVLQIGQSAIVASMSAANTPGANERRVYFTSGVSNVHSAGTIMITPVTSVHTIKFTTQAALSAGYKIQIVFPGTGTNSASPSATGFAFNNEIAQPTDVTCRDITAGTDCTAAPTDYSSNQLNSYTISVGTGVTIATGHVVVLNIGCTARDATTGICTAAAPRLVNPTKGTGYLGLGTGTADNWKIQVSILDTGSNPIETTKTVAATVESVQVQGIIEPYITFSIAGVPNGTTINNAGNNPGCTSNTDVTNTGIDSSSTFVNMGAMGAGISIAAQNLTITTNGTGGYVLTATSSGQFINPATGFAFLDANISQGGLTANDAPAAGFITAGNTSFGIHACGTDAMAAWNTGTTGGGANAKYANPWNTGAHNYYATLASYGAGIPPSSRKTTVEYEATAATNVPAGTYTTALTYVATPAF
jgi:hypothetical protein